MVYFLFLTIGALIGVFGVGIFHRQADNKARYLSDIAFKCMVTCGISPSTAEIIRQMIEREIYGDEEERTDNTL